MKYLLILIVAVIASANGVCIKGQKYEACAKEIVNQAERDIVPICANLFNTLRALTVDAYNNKKLVNQEAVLKITGERLYAVVRPAAAKLTVILGSDANMTSLYDRLLKVVTVLVNDNVSWINTFLSDQKIVLSRQNALAILNQSIGDAEIYDAELKQHLKVALIGYVNGILHDAVVSVSNNTPVKPICHETFDALRSASLQASISRKPLDPNAIIAKSSEDLATVVGKSANIISSILINDVPYTQLYTQLLEEVVALIHKTVAVINKANTNSLRLFGLSEDEALITKCQNDSHQLWINLLVKLCNLMFTSLTQ